MDFVVEVVIGIRGELEKAAVVVAVAEPDFLSLPGQARPQQPVHGVVVVVVDEKCLV